MSKTGVGGVEEGMAYTCKMPQVVFFLISNQILLNPRPKIITRYEGHELIFGWTSSLDLNMYLVCLLDVQ